MMKKIKTANLLAVGILVVVTVSLVISLTTKETVNINGQNVQIKKNPLGLGK